MIVFWSSDQSQATVITPSGWTELYTDDNGNFFNGYYRRIAWYRIADGTEGTQLSVTTDGSFGSTCKSAHNSYRVAAGTYSGIPVVGAVATGSSTSPNPPSLTSGFGATNTLWIATSHSAGSTTVNPPASYTTQTLSNTGGNGTGNATMATATLQSANATENPGNFSITSGQWAANTIAIKGVSNKVATVDYINLTVTYQLNGVLNWYDSAIDGTLIGTGSPFNPVGVSGSGIPDNTATGKYTFYAECSNVPGCRTAATFEIIQGPDAPVAGNNTYIYDGTAQTMSATVSQPNVVVDWYANSTGGSIISAPQLTSAGDITAYAEARNTVTHCVSLTRTPVTLTINRRPITISANLGQTKIYGQDDPLPFLYTVAGMGLGTGDQFNGALDRVAGEIVGNYAINKGLLQITDASLINKESNYDITFNSADFVITKAALTIRANDLSKTYGDLVTFSGLGFTTTGLVFLDVVSSATITSTGAVDTAPVGSYDINITDALGTGLENYNITYVKGALTVTAKDLIIAAIDKSKEYGTAYTFVETLLSPDFTVTGIIQTDAVTSVTMTSAGAAANANVAGSPYTITPSAATGTGLGNYHIIYNPALMTVTPKDLNVSASAENKIYDGLTTAVAHLTTNALAGDDVTAAYLNSDFADKNVGIGKTVSVSGISINGTDAGNYTLLNNSATTTADITARSLIVSATGIDKIYDGTTTATVTLSDNRVAGDVFTSTYTGASFADKNVGNGKAVTVTGISISGADAGNYTYNTTAATTANITGLALTISAAGIDKIYDGTTNATVTLSDNRLAGDIFTATYTGATFADKNVGNGKAVTVTGISIIGPDAGNYTYNTTAATTANITGQALTISATGIDKIYDGTTTATVTLSDNRVAGDVFTATYTGATFADKNVGNGKAVTVTGISISGPDAGNYTYNTTAATTANITGLALTISATGIDKIYDGTNTATVTLSDNRLAGDIFTATYTGATFADKNVGNGKPVTVTGISISGPDAGNYTYNTTAATTANITGGMALTISATGIDKIYDGTTTATVTLSDNRIAGDVFTATYTGATFADKNVGNGKAVTVTGISISGPDAGNYTYNTTAATTANITALALTISATGIDKIYDGTTTATVTLSDNRIAGDIITTTYSGATFADKNVGNGKAVTVTGISISGPDASNYTYNTTAATTANITGLALTISATGIDKIYDGTTTATVTLSDNRLAGDIFTATYTGATFADKNVGNGKAVTVTGISISGPDAGNYTYNTTAATTANITAGLALTISATGIDKIYDGTTTATVTLSDNRVVGDVFTATYTGATFADKNVGNGKAVTVTGISISGPDAGNYTYNTTAATTANITALALTISATGIDKIYDGTTAATVTLSDNRVAGDVFTATYTGATFADKNVGNGKAVTVTGISISGPDAGNYTYNTTAATTANITAGMALTISATGIDKIYDGTNTATVTLSDNRIAGDVFTATYTGATFADKNVGNGKAVTVTGISISGPDAGNYTYNTTAATTANITGLTLTISATGIDKIYDGTTTATVTLSDNRIAGDVFTATYAGATFADKNVGNGKAVTVTGISISGPDAGNYTYNTTASTTANITGLALTISATGIDKIYDGTNTATVTLSDNRLAGDIFTSTYTGATFADKNVGNGKAVTVTGISISGADAGNYTYNTTAATTANITGLALTISATGIDKIYDGTTTATVTMSDNRVAGDVFTATYTGATFADKNVGNGKPVTVTGISISGVDAGNYTYNTTAATTANITGLALTISATGIDKIYDGTTTATVTLSDNRLAGDVFTATYTGATFADKNVGNGKAVTVTGISISGADAGNYTYNTTAATTANITGLALTISATGIDKIYDGTTTATVTLSDNRLAGDIITATYTGATFADKNVGNGKAVTVTGLSISGADAGNYTYNTTAATTANITGLALTISATGIDKIYDGTTTATVTLSDNRIAGDILTAIYTGATFADKNVGNGKAVTVTGISISGADAGNYTYNTTAATTANITGQALTITATGIDKIYDGTTTATVTLSDNRIAGDIFTATYTGATFADKNVGNGKPVTVTGISISGPDGGNYTYNTTAATTANITGLALTISATGIDKIYDGTTTATVTLSDNRLAGDIFTATYTGATFADKNIGNGKAVTVTGISISGADAGNYTYNTTAATTANITAMALTISATGIDKIYDGTTTAAVTLSDNRIAGDIFTVTYTGATFADKNVGNGKAVTVTGISISGPDASNYTYNTTASTTANITGLALTISATGIDKIYDGTTTATVTLSDNRLAGDIFTSTYTGATFADKNVGNGKAVTVTGISISGPDAGNYTYNTTAATTANITGMALTISATGIDKIYDGTTAATVTLSDNRLAGDVFTATYTGASFADKNVGNGKAVTVTGISISGADAGNYTYNTTAATTANITGMALTISATGIDKIYDGTTAATVTLSDNRLAGDVFTATYTGASFADKNVGNGKAVTVTGISISGADAGNYTYNTTAATTANITGLALTISATGIDKIYDGTTAATVTLSDNRLAGDVFTATYTGATFADKNVGNGKAVTVTGISIIGPDAGNYTYNTTAATTANITGLALTISATGIDKIYDGTTTATVTLSDNRVAGDVFTATYTGATFADKNVGNGKAVTVTGISISGADAGNYTYNTTAATTANITGQALTISATGIDKIYDGTTTATVTLSDNRLAGDVFTATYTGATFADKNVGNGKAVTVTGISISGPDAGNYTYNTTAATTANITAGMALTISATGIDKIYDGTTTATVTLSDNRIAGDVFTATYTGATFADKNVSNGKAVTVTGISISGPDAANYTYNTTAATTANITALALTISATGIDKIYDGTTTATVTLSDNRIAGDIITTTYIGSNLC